jgi:hypothetical protein
VMTVAVVPLGTMVLYAVGVLRGIFRRRDRAFCAMLILCAAMPLLFLAAGLGAAKDGEQQIMASFPFLAALAGAGFSWLTRLLRSAFQRIRLPILATVLTVAAAFLFLVPPIGGIIIYSPNLLSYYSETIGGLPGAARMGLETTYGCGSYREAVDFINANAQAGDTVWVEPSCSEVLVYYQIHGILRDDVSIAVSNQDDLETVFGSDAVAPKVMVSHPEATFVIIQYRQTFLLDSNGNPGEVMQWLSALEPAYRVERMGVPILDVYWRQ